MGATCWSHFTAYEPDVTTAFARLQADIFSRGAFYAHEGASFSSIEELRDVQGEEGTHSILDIRKVIAEPFLPPLSREMELSLLMSGADVFPGKRVGEGRAASGGWEAVADGTIVRMNDEWLVEWFSTTTPDRSTIEANESKVWEMCERGTGLYTFVFDVDKTVPVSIYFVGVSGD